MNTTTQTIRLGGQRVKLTTRNGRVTTTKALPLEHELQAAQVRALKAMPEYGTQFLIAGDQNAGKRGPKAQAIALATGMAAGDPDLRVYLPRGQLGLIENKVGRAPLTESQRVRHPLLAKLGHPVEVVRATTEEEAAARAVGLVRGWLSDNDNSAESAKKIA